eukprot:m.121408 g.121408  ORF g.121408 m.121408 type:complete len:206 (+) comp14394_c0_seq2:230-847(+)
MLTLTFVICFLINVGHACEEEHKGNFNPSAIVMATWSNRGTRFPISKALNLRYAKRHSYRVMFNDTRALESFPYAWEKIALVKYLLQNKSVQAVFLIDDDAFVRKPNISVQQWFVKFPKASIIVGIQDAYNHGHTINTGVMIIRNTRWSRVFFDDVLINPSCNRTKKRCCWEQDCMRKLLKPTHYNGVVQEIPLGEFNCQESHKL